MTGIFTLTVYAPLDLNQITGQPHAMPTGEYKDHLPKFVGSNAISVEDCLNVFLKFVDDLEIEHEDVRANLGRRCMSLV